MVLLLLCLYAVKLFKAEKTNQTENLITLQLINIDLMEILFVYENDLKILSQQIIVNRLENI